MKKRIWLCGGSADFSALSWAMRLKGTAPVRLQIPLPTTKEDLGIAESIGGLLLGSTRVMSVGKGCWARQLGERSGL
jgi:hypothetical protein